VRLCIHAIFEQSGRTLSGQTLKRLDFDLTRRPVLRRLNCGMARDFVAAYVEELSNLAPMYTHAYLNAGLPNAFGGYDWTPEQVANPIGEFARNGWLNIVGGCCGTTPDHIRAVAQAVEGVAPRVPSEPSKNFRVSGMKRS
jgi:5-methyltetrahydrofolate--homocysteine methyltransferase